MITLPLTFLAPAVLAVQLVAPAPVLALAFQAPQALAVELVATAPTLRLTIRAPQLLDAALLPVLIGPPGPAGADGGGAASAPVSRSFAYSGGQLVAVAYAGGASKALAYTGAQLTQVDHLRPGLPTRRAVLSYHPDGTLAAVLQTEV